MPKSKPNRPNVSKDRTNDNKKSTTARVDAQDDTIFIRNLSFDTDEDSLKKFIEENFGSTTYCLVCKDKETDESKGTAFAKFRNPEDAAKCLLQFKDRDLMTKFHLDGRNLIVLPSISRDRISEATKKEEKSTDKRNLALAKEGFIHPQADEAKDMSKSDNEKRKVLHIRKKEQLKNLHNFVSDTRLCVHNLPASVDDQRLRKIFLDQVKGQHPDAKIVECRVMRNKKGGGQLGTSKGFGFVSFSKHEHAMSALRLLNNNSTIFSKDRRPIVEFSIENLVALNKKKTRLVNSQRKNQALQAKSNQPSIEETSSKKVKKTKTSSKTMKRKSTVTVKNIDTSEQSNILNKLKKLRKEKNKISVG